MNALPTIEEFSAQATGLLFDSEALDAFIDKLRAASDTSRFSVGTESGRAQIKSAAHRVSRYKSGLDAAGKKATEDLRKKTAEINAVRNAAVEKLETLQADIKRPVEQWEEQERARMADLQRRVNEIIALSTVPAGATSADLEARLEKLKAIAVDASFDEQMDTAFKAKEDGMSALWFAIEAAKKAEADAAELAELRRQKAEADAKAAEQERQRRAAEAEAQRKAEEERRIAAAELRAAEEAKAAAERQHREELARVEREAQEKIEAARRAAQALADAERRAREEAERKATEEKAREERRAANDRHRAKVRAKAVAAMKAAVPMPAELAEAIFDAIAAGAIPNIVVEF